MVNVTSEMTSKKPPVKILFAGDVNGRFRELITRVNAVVKKCGAFDVLFCVGEFFGSDETDNRRVADGLVDFPIPTYVLGPCCPSTSATYPDESTEFSSTLTYLGRRGILNTASGLSVGYLSGVERADWAENAGGRCTKFEFDELDVDELLTPVRANAGFQGVDVLLTSGWPAQVAKHSSNQPPKEMDGSKLISRLVAGLKPRYHVAGLGSHYERTPYRNHRVLLESAQLVTRFIGLAHVGNQTKEKWLYACSITPMRRMEKAELTVQPDNTTEFPYADVLAEFSQRKSVQEAKVAKNNGAQFFFDTEADPNEEDSVDRGGRRRQRASSVGGDIPLKRPVVQPDTCWFCLSNAAVVKHLIVAVGRHCYAAMPKGPLTDDHIMVMSINHIQSLVAASAEVRAECVKFCDSLALMADASQKVLCVFERNYKTSHLQLQCVPVPRTMTRAMRSAFLNVARLRNIDFTFLKEGEQIWDLVNEGQPYFYVELPDGTRLYTRSMAGFPIQFGREVLCSNALLNDAERVDWHRCELGELKETELVVGLKTQFKPFDFTQTDGDSDDD